MYYTIGEGMRAKNKTQENKNSVLAVRSTAGTQQYQVQVLRVLGVPGILGADMYFIKIAIFCNAPKVAVAELLLRMFGPKKLLQELCPPDK